jgi:hypothetical protein
VTVQLSESTPRSKTVIPDIEAKNETLRPPLWKVQSQHFQELTKQFRSLPDSSDAVEGCPRNFLQIEFVEKDKTTVKFSCYNTSNAARKKYVEFTRKIM